MNRISTLIWKAMLCVGAIPLGVYRMAKREARRLFLSSRHPGVTFHEGCQADESCSFETRVHIAANTRLGNSRIGAYTYVGGDSLLQHCTLGRFCSVGPQVQIGLAVHPVQGVISTYPGFYSARRSGATRFHVEPSISEFKQVTIGNDVWIGTRSMILGGVRIGDGAVIGAGSVVTRDVEPYAIVAGVPARMIRKRFTQEEVATLLRFAWWMKDEAWLEEHGHLFLNPNGFFALAAGEGGTIPEPATSAKSPSAPTGGGSERMGE